METLQKSPVANKLLPSLMVKASNAYGDVAKKVKMPPEIESQMARTSLRSILKQVAKSITPADVQQLNGNRSTTAVKQKQSWSQTRLQQTSNFLFANVRQLVRPRKQII